MARYSVRYIHAISPRPTDVGPDVELTKEDLTDARSLAKALREAHVLCAGSRLREYREEGHVAVGTLRIVAFPDRSAGWHSIILTKVVPDIRFENHGSVWIIVPETDAGREWVADNVQTDMTFGQGYACEHRYVQDIISGAIDAGLKTEVA
jgi:hypothetical protein